MPRIRYPSLTRSHAQIAAAASTAPSGITLRYGYRNGMAHLLAADRGDEAARQVTDAPYNSLRRASEGTSDVDAWVLDVGAVAARDGSADMRAWFAFAAAAAPRLRKGDDVWSASAILSQVARETPHTNPVFRAWEAHGTRLSGRDHLLVADTPTVGTEGPQVLLGHTGGFDAFSCIELVGGRLLSRHTDIRVWSLYTGLLTAQYPLSEAPLVVRRHPSAKTIPLPDKDQHGRPVLWTDADARIWFQEVGWYGSSLCTAIQCADGRVLMRESPSAAVVRSPDGRGAVTRFDGHDAPLDGMEILPDGSILTWSNDGTLCRWNAHTGAEIWRVTHDSMVDGVAFVRSGHILSWVAAGRFRKINLATGVHEDLDDVLPPVKGAREQPGESGVWNLDSSDGSTHTLLVNAGHLVVVDHELRPRWTTKRDANGPIAVVDRRVIACLAKGGGSIRVLAMDGTLLTEFRDEGKRTDGMIALRDGSLCTWSGYKAGSDCLRVWTPPTGGWTSTDRPRCTSLAGHELWIYTATVLSDGRVASCGEDDTIRIWDTTTQAESPPKLRPRANYIYPTSWRDKGCHGHGELMIAWYNDYAPDHRSLTLVDPCAASIHVCDIDLDGRKPPEVQRISSEYVVIDGVEYRSIHGPTFNGTLLDIPSDEPKHRSIVPLSERTFVCVEPGLLSVWALDELDLMCLVCETPTPDVDKRTRGVGTSGGYLALWRDDGALAVHKVRPDDEEGAVIETCGTWKLAGLAGVRWTSSASVVAWNASGDVWFANEDADDGAWHLTQTTSCGTGAIVAVQAESLLRRAEDGSIEWWDVIDSCGSLIGRIPPPTESSWTDCVPMSGATAMALSSNGKLYRVDFTRSEARPAFPNLHCDHLSLLGSSEDAFHMHSRARGLGDGTPSPRRVGRDSLDGLVVGEPGQPKTHTSLMLVAGVDAEDIRAVAATHDRVEVYAPDGRMLARWIAPRSTGERGEFAVVGATRSRVVAAIGSELWSLDLLNTVTGPAMQR